MSKTYRRKNAQWSFRDYEYTYENGFLEKVYFDKNSKEYKRKKAVFHSDSFYNYGSCVPHWYVNMFHEKPERRRVKSEIKKWMNNPEKKELLLFNFNKGAGWNYW